MRRESLSDINLLVSIVIPCYNVEEDQLARCLESVYKQSYENIEIILVDDGSDHPLSRHHHLLEDPRLQLVSLPRNMGVGYCRNLGMKKSKGEFIAFLDSDDWWDHRKIQMQIEKFYESNNEKLGAVYCGVYTVDRGTGRTKMQRPGYKNDIFNYLLVRQVVTGSCSSVMIKRYVFEDVGFFIDAYDLPEDREYWMRIAKRGWWFDFIDEPLVYLEQNQNSRSSNPFKKKVSNKRLLLLYDDDLRKYNKLNAAWAKYYIGLARKMYRNKIYFHMLSLFLTAIIKHPMGIYQLGIEVIGRRFRTQKKSF